MAKKWEKQDVKQESMVDAAKLPVRSAKIGTAPRLAQFEEHPYRY